MTHHFFATFLEYGICFIFFKQLRAVTSMSLVAADVGSFGFQSRLDRPQLLKRYDFISFYIVRYCQGISHVFRGA